MSEFAVVLTAPALPYIEWQDAARWRGPSGTCPVTPLELSLSADASRAAPGVSSLNGVKFGVTRRSL
jgi:hypothetical protein